MRVLVAAENCHKHEYALSPDPKSGMTGIREPLHKSSVERVACRIGMARVTLRQRSSAVKRTIAAPLLPIASLCSPALATCRRPALRRCARRATKVVARSTKPRSATQQAPDFAATLRDGALQAVCGVRLVAKGMAIRVLAFRASHPAKPPSRPRGTCSAAP